ncbi:MAG: T9SS type A sorting domain-containing protein [Ignavibacteria bacterium]|jgi:N-acetylmuramoyl-L-alanine amidase|nr:T9SS type A sorting domain-containing protein [Ignavibacteria bacterium]MCU7504193.1 T9SS type A sorting domain-containing protein [Ignavibacteria bacterium]MCU7518118.1 T9SS type A sorting domain-containing protein [Ignavibacteria bacterium]
MKKQLLAVLFLLFSASFLFGQSLSGIKIYINPGHGGYTSNDRHILETDYWESEGNLTRGLFLRDILQKLGATVIMSRVTNTEDDDIQPTSYIAARANTYNPDYFHSIHSNATGTSTRVNYTLLLFQGTTTSPTYPLAKTMAGYIGNEILGAHRTTTRDIAGDFTFYNSTGPYLGVFVGLKMPGTLSESSFHDYIPESWRLRNQAYLKHEAWAIAKAFLAYWGKPPLTTGIIAGILRDPDLGVSYTSLTLQDAKKPVNSIKVTLKPADALNTMEPVVYEGDNLNNGFFMFDELTPGQYKLYYEAPGYFRDSSTVTVQASKNTFADKDLLSTVPPFVVSVSPASGDSIYPGKEDIVISFSRAMNKASVESAISVSPKAPLTFTWSSEKNLTVATAGLPFMTDFTLTIGAGAQEKSHGLSLDGNKDGVSGDIYTCSFRTRLQDLSAPVLETVYPSDNMENVEPMPLINISFNEQINTSTASGRIKLVRNSDQKVLALKANYLPVDGQKSVFCFFPVDTLMENESYSLIISSGIEDLYKNPTSSEKVYTFKTGSKLPTMVYIDKFESGFTANWVSPLTYSSGITSAGTNFASSSIYRFYGSSSSMLINYSWKKSASSWLLREPLIGGAPKNVTFSNSGILQAYIFGDGSNNKFRFCVADGSDFKGLEVSPWYTINWIGWRLLSWDMQREGTGTWDGNTSSNGILDGQLKFDSFQLSYIPGNPESGFICLDNLRAAKDSYMGVEEGDEDLRPSNYSLAQNYPNPFNPSTTLSYKLPEKSFVSLKVFDLLGREVATLVNSEQGAGSYKVEFNASNIPSGIYLYMLRTDNFQETKKMVLLK